MEGDCAVHVQNVDKYYRTRQILLGLSMRVEKGSIYGLLGPSGCGKTTLLSCIVGRRRIDSGCVWVLGGVPGGGASGVPGPRVGYMPQDTALVGEFSVKGAIYYFGRISEMPGRRIAERYEFLRRLLELPPDERMIKDCSGGEQRRVSFACAMVHEPELLILDEPTVGLDPVMRNSIWMHLMEMARTSNAAIIITTHYIEEAKQADRIGLMRGGRLLAEESPSQLLASFGTNSLEEVFLSLSRQHESGTLLNRSLEENHTPQNGDSKSAEAHLTACKQQKQKVKNERCAVSRHRIKALMGKNFLQYFKNMTCLIANLIFPIADVLLFLLAIGGDVNVDIGVVNREFGSDVCRQYVRENTAIPRDYIDCDLRHLSCRFLDDLRDGTINKVYYDDFGSAMADARHGKVIGVMYFADNFTRAFQGRMELGGRTDNETLDLSEIKVWLDMSNRQVGMALKFKLLGRYLDFQRGLARDCNYSEKLVNMPLNVRHEYGDDKEPFINFMIPGIMLSIVYFASTTMTCFTIIQDRSEGVWDRSIVAGVTSVEIVLTHFATQFIVVCLQAAQVLAVTFALYGTQYVGSFALIASAVLLQGMGGLVCGFWISVISSDHNMANILASGLFFPIFVLCGMMWPLEGQPPALRFVSESLPFTAAVVSLRHVMKKGWGLERLEVMRGAGISLLWIVCLIALSVYLIRKKR